MTSIGSEHFTQPLIERYGFENVVWPIVIIENNKRLFYAYEINQLFDLNHESDNRPISSEGLADIFIDYASNPSRIVPSSEMLLPFIKKDFNCSYDFILTTDKYASVDIDYVWKTSVNWKGLELTTVWVPLKNEVESERLVKMFNRRPSWQGVNGPHGLRKLIDACADLKIDYYLAVVNSINKVSNDLRIEGNAYWFPLTHENVSRIIANEAPNNALFGTFNELIEWL